MDADGSEETLLVSAPAEGSAQSPSWSPDGDRIAYAWTESGTAGDTMFVAAPDGSGATAVLEMSDGLGELDWSPDGSRIVFMGRTEGGYYIDLYDIELDGGAVTQLTEGMPATTPAWSPDGQLITFTRYSEDESPDAVWVMNADGSEQIQLTPDDVTARQPTWQAVLPTYELTVDPESAQREVGEDHTLRFTLVESEPGYPEPDRDLSVQVTGAHPQAATVTTGDDGRATFTWVGSQTGTDTVTACADVDGNEACDADDPVTTATVLWDTAGEVDEPRLAFTDDADGLYVVDVDRGENDVGAIFYSSGQTESYATDLSGYEAGPKHEGEAGGTPGSAPAFVSTRDDPNGDVYVATDPDATRVTRVTCDPGIETHPVVNTDGAVAYASDADGDWDIYVAAPPPVVVRHPPPAWSHREEGSIRRQWQGRHRARLSAGLDHYPGHRR